MSEFSNVRRFCFFAAPPRSGHSIVGHLLTCHPDVLICDELHALQQFHDGQDAAAVYRLIQQQNTKFERRGRIKSGYDYRVPGTSQDRLDKNPIVIGDAKGGATMLLLDEYPDVVDRVRTATGASLRCIFQSRHPFDIVATVMKKLAMPLPAAVDQIVAISGQMEKAYRLLDDSEKLVQSHEAIIADPHGQFSRTFEFLGVESIGPILDAIAAKLWKQPNETRASIEWDPEQRGRLVEAMRASRFFAHYFEAV